MLEMMLSAGHTLEKGTVVDVQSAANRVFALDDAGVLYGRGVDSASTGLLGNGGNSVIGYWQTIFTNVKQFWVGSSATLILTNDNRWFWFGRYMTGTGSAVVTPTEITSSFSALGTNTISKLAIGLFGFAVLDTLGNLYTMGNNSTGWAFTGNTTAQTVLTLRTETNIKDIAFCGTVGTFYIHYNDLSVKGAGAAAVNQLGSPTANQTSLVVVSTASQAAEEIVAGANLIWFKRAAGWYFLGSNTNGQSGQNTATGTGGTSHTLLSGSSGWAKLISSGYRTWAQAGPNWYFSGSGDRAAGNINTVPPFNGTNVLTFSLITTTGYPILSSPIGWVDGGSNTSYFLYEGFIYGCGNSTVNKLLPGNGTTNNLLGFRKLNNDFAFVE